MRYGSTHIPSSVARKKAFGLPIRRQAQIRKAHHLPWDRRRTVSPYVQRVSQLLVELACPNLWVGGITRRVSQGLFPRTEKTGCCSLPTAPEIRPSLASPDYCACSSASPRSFSCVHMEVVKTFLPERGRTIDIKRGTRSSAINQQVNQPVTH